MRKVMYQLNSLSEPMPGFFHCWAGTMQDAYAIIEDTTTGKMHRVNDDQFRFMTPPETKTNWYSEFKNNSADNDALHFITGRSPKWQDIVFGKPFPKTVCTKPDCHCLEAEEAKQGGPVKSYPCLCDNRSDLEQEKSKP